jgi:predicted phosphodiesterase
MSGEFLPPVVFFSDLHLRSLDDWECELEGLRGLWSNAKTVLFNGDTLSWEISRCPELREKLRNDITDFFHHNALKTIFVAGNSDQELSEQNYCFMCEKKILALHGHVIFDDVSPWNYHAPRIEKLRQEFLESIPQQSRDTLDASAQSARAATLKIQRWCLETLGKNSAKFYVFLKIHKLRTLLRLRTILRSWRNTPIFGVKFLERYAPQTKFLIMGHTHRSGVWKLNGRVIINTGSIKNHRQCLLVRLENNNLKVFRIRRDKKQLIPSSLVEEFAI